MMLIKIPQGSFKMGSEKYDREKPVHQVTINYDFWMSQTEVTFEQYDAHTPTVTLDDNSGVNEEGTSGHVVQLTNTTEAGVGSQATYGITYQYQFGDVCVHVLPIK